MFSIQMDKSTRVCGLPDVEKEEAQFVLPMELFVSTDTQHILLSEELPISCLLKLFVILLDEGRFKDDNMEGQGTMKMNSNAIIPQHSDEEEDSEDDNTVSKDSKSKNDWMIPIEFQSDISHIHQKAGFTQVGL